MIEIAPEVLALLLAVAFFAGFVDAIAGGGGLITLPVLILAGAPPLTAIATNKVQSVFGAAMAVWSYGRAGHVDLRRQRWVALLALVGGGCGAALTSTLPTEMIRVALPVLLVSIALFFALKPGLNDIDRAARLTPMVFSVTVVPLIAFYDGFIGPGAGSFYMIGFVALAGYGVLNATAHTKLLNLASNFGGVCIYALVASPWWITGVLMGLAQLAGAYAGARLAMRNGARLIKPLLVVSASVLAAKLIWDMV
ncbi:MAG: TSUP family transporter [Octadecabacter sp.]|nr:TSUP family transporter [Octadecabacter sp.]